MKASPSQSPAPTAHGAPVTHLAPVATPATFAPGTPLATLASALADGRTTSRALIETALERIADPAGQGATVFVAVDPEQVRGAADAADLLRRSGTVLSPLAGLPISVKDLFDVAHQVTRGGSRALANAAPARDDATVVARLRRAGAILIGRTNMSEFAFSGLGLNPHYGTPLSPWDRQTGRIAGGSSSGAAASVADGMAAAAIGTDTGGSLRIPAAFCGLTGFKPTAHRIPLAGVMPLSSTLDSAGPIGAQVACCALLDRVLAQLDPVLPALRPLAGARIGVLCNFVCDDLDAAVAAAFDRALKALSAAGAHLAEIRIDALDRIPQINRVTFASMEAYAWHRPLLAAHGGAYDPHIYSRIVRGGEASATDYLDLLAERRVLIDAARPQFERFDALVCPTVPIVPPRLDELTGYGAAADDAFARLNGLALRNPSVVNMLDGCALSIPCQRPGDAPVGFMLCAGHARDDALLGLGMAVQQALESAL